MLWSHTKKYTDESDEKQFRFTFYCDHCGRPFISTPIMFMGGYNFEQNSDENEELWKLRWQKDHLKAFSRANQQASLYFFCCPGCGEYICPGCTVSEITATGDIKDRCLKCHCKLRKKMMPMYIVEGNLRKRVVPKMSISDFKRDLTQISKRQLPPITKEYADESDEKQFLFTFYCDHCGTGYQMPPLPFSDGDNGRDFDSFTNVAKLIWQSEHDDAYEHANERAMSCFKHCLGCQKMICENCINEIEDIPICPDCRNLYDR